MEKAAGSVAGKKSSIKDEVYYEWLKMRISSILLITLGYGSAFAYTINVIYQSHSKIHSSNFNLLFFGTNFAIISCLMYYIRKLYKHLIRGEVTLITMKTKVTVEEIGTFIYFVARPFMALVFSIIAFFIMEVFFRLTISNGTGYSEGYIMLVAIIEFLGGFSVGRFVENTEHVAKRVVDNLFRKVGE